MVKDFFVELSGLDIVNVADVSALRVNNRVNNLGENTHDAHADIYLKSGAILSYDFKTYDIQYKYIMNLRNKLLESNND